MNQQIQEFNQILIDDEIELTIIDYVKKLNEQFYKIDISFIDELIDFIDKDNCCIPHEYLQKSDVYSLSGGSGDVLKILEKLSAVEDHHFTLRKVSDRDDYRHKNEYLLHPDMFKQIIISSTKNDKYRIYNVHLERSIKYYNQYQIRKLNKKLQSICEYRVLKIKDEEKQEVFV